MGLARRHRRRLNGVSCGRGAHHAGRPGNDLADIGTRRPYRAGPARILDDEFVIHGRVEDEDEGELHRIAAVDRNILRLAIYEMLHRDDIPPVVSINEAVDIAKKFSTQESGKFVNGILDKIKSGLMRPARIVK